MNWRTMSFGCAATAIIVATLSYVLIVFVGTSSNLPDNERKIISACIDSHRDTTRIQPVDLDLLNKLNSFCFNSTRSQLLVDEENIRKDNFVFQRYENVVLLFMVVVITLSGVALAGLQLLASYKLAVLGRGELVGGGEISYSNDAVSFKSSVVGLVILFISFAFFMVFVLDVYTLKEVTSSNTSQPGIPSFESSQPHSLYPFPSLQPAPQTLAKPPATGAAATVQP